MTETGREEIKAQQHGSNNRYRRERKKEIFMFFSDAFQLYLDTLAKLSI